APPRSALGKPRERREGEDGDARLLPVVEPEAEREEGDERGPPPKVALAGDGDARSAEEVERRVVADHREDAVVGERLDGAVVEAEVDGVLADGDDVGAHAERERTG